MAQNNSIGHTTTHVFFNANAIHRKPWYLGISYEHFTSVHRTNASNIMMIEIHHIFTNNDIQIKSSICIL